MRPVSESTFFAELYADKRDIMPTTERPDVTIWRVQATRQEWGRTYPGWKESGNPNTPKTYERVN